MKNLLPLLFLLPATGVFAEACPHTDYAELKDMKQVELQTKYCELKKYQASKEQEANDLAHSGSLISLQYMQYSFQCESEAKRVAEVLERSFSVAPSQCPSEADTSTPPKPSESQSSNNGE